MCPLRSRRGSPSLAWWLWSINNSRVYPSRLFGVMAVFEDELIQRVNVSCYAQGIATILRNGRWELVALLLYPCRRFVAGL